MIGPILALALTAAQKPPTDPGEVIKLHRVFRVDAHVVLWLEGHDDDIVALGLDPVRAPLQVERLPFPIGDGVFIELLSGRLELLGVYRGAVPAPGERCGVAIPAVGGTWWVTAVERRDGETRVLGRWQVGPELARLVADEKLPLS